MLDKEHFSKVSFQNFQILEITLFRSSPDHDASNTIVGLRILFYVLNELQRFSDDCFQQILDKLIELVINDEEPIKTHAIKCLHVFVSNGKRLEKSYTKLKNLLNMLIKNVAKYINVETDDIIILDPSNDQIDVDIDDFDRSSVCMNEIDENEL
ncbi:hypothetical protein RF11_13209 [Thelohanellus kitauei]|uniref:Uncharacterized protein n=1 Tax=Thelohanellus kitauei TaxID=669202 RepID=A0A0C2N2E2_THEKT|nr:hypothetical protein RF11_13209 [Thelohanellus kitauei]